MIRSLNYVNDHFTATAKPRPDSQATDMLFLWCLEYTLPVCAGIFETAKKTHQTFWWVLIDYQESDIACLES